MRFTYNTRSAGPFATNGNTYNGTVKACFNSIKRKRGGLWPPKAANPYDRLDDLRRRAEPPNLVTELLGVWGWGLADPELDCGSLYVDCGMIFSSSVPATWIKMSKTCQ